MDVGVLPPRGQGLLPAGRGPEREAADRRSQVTFHPPQPQHAIALLLTEPRLFDRNALFRLTLNNVSLIQVRFLSASERGRGGRCAGRGQNVFRESNAEPENMQMSKYRKEGRQDHGPPK